MATTQRQRDAKAREEKLALIREQVKEGTLVIRKMTPEERRRNPARPRDDSRRRKRSR
jgi:hypothetical protein